MVNKSRHCHRHNQDDLNDQDGQNKHNDQYDGDDVDYTNHVFGLCFNCLIISIIIYFQYGLLTMSMDY